MKKKFNTKKAKKHVESMGITRCEVRLAGCDNWFLTYAHRQKRRFYPNDGILLNDPDEYVLACLHCHQIMEQDPTLTKEVFSRLRPTQ